VALDSALPCFKHFLVGLFFICYAFLVIDLGELSGPLVIHLGLQLPANLTIPLANLPKNVSLVGFASACVRHGLLGEGLVLALDLGIKVRFFVLNEPFSLIL